jgi:hypothetical protein
MPHPDEQPPPSAIEEARRLHRAADEAAARARTAWELAEQQRLAARWAAQRARGGGAATDRVDRDPDLFTPAIDAVLRRRLGEGPRDRPVPNP